MDRPHRHGGAPPTRLGRQSPRRGDVFRPLATISPVARDSRLQSSPIGDDDVTLRSIPARIPWQVASSRPLVSLCGLSRCCCWCSRPELRDRQVALQRPARRRGLRLPDLSEPARQGTGSLAVHRNHAAPVGGGRLLLHALPPGLDGVTADGHRLAVARLLPASSTPGSASSCVRGPCTSSAASGSTRRSRRSRWPRSAPQFSSARSSRARAARR